MADQVVPGRDPSRAGSGTEAADRVADVLLLFTHGAPSLGVSEIARELSLSKAVVFRILQSLVSRGLLSGDRATRGYQLGPAAVTLGVRAFRDLDMRRAARVPLRRLRDETGETTTLSLRAQGFRVYLDQYESRHEIKMTVEVGRRYPLHAGASSRAILAFLPPETVADVVAAGLPPITSDTITDESVLRRRLAATRASGVAVSRQERQDGAASVAAPVLNIDGDAVGAISVCGPVTRFDRATVKRYTPMVQQAAGEISHALGWNGGEGLTARG